MWSCPYALILIFIEVAMKVLISRWAVGIEVLMKMWVRHSRQKINMAIGRNKACLVLEESLDSGVNR